MTVLFVADLHLCQQRPDLTQAFVDFLKTTAQGCHSLYLLGDIFEAWIGDDYIDPCLQPVIQQLKALSSAQSALYFQHGNRDFLVGKRLADLIGAKLLEESVIVQLPSQKALIMHGDQLCTDDLAYQKFRSMVRSPDWQQEFLAKSIQERLQIAEHLRTTSKAETGSKTSQITDVSHSAVLDALQHAQVNLLIHGHTHRPATHSFTDTGKQLTRMVLGDWDQSLWYIQCDKLGCTLIEQKIS